MIWEHPESETIPLQERELGDLVVRVEAKDTGSGQKMCQMELLTSSGPLRRYGHPGNRTSFTRHFNYDYGRTALIGMDQEATAANPEQIAFWLFVTSYTNWEGRLTPAKWDKLRCEHQDGSLEDRMVKAYLEDARNLLDSGLSCCVALHLTDLSIRYNAKVSRRMDREKILECWDRRILTEVMKS